MSDAREEALKQFIKDFEGQIVGYEATFRAGWDAAQREILKADSEGFKIREERNRYREALEEIAEEPFSSDQCQFMAKRASRHAKPTVK